MFAAAHAVMTQLERVAPLTSHQAPPPQVSRTASPSASVWPLVSVNPSSTALLAIQAQRTAPAPTGPWPTIVVTAAPLTLCTTIPFVIAMRLVMPP